MKSLAQLICTRTHPAEWSSPFPRTHPCSHCYVLARAIARAGWRKP